MDNEIRNCEISIRDTGIEELLKGLAEGGHCSAGQGRVYRDESSIYVTFCINTGTIEAGIKALSLQLKIALSEKENKIQP